MYGKLGKANFLVFWIRNIDADLNPDQVKAELSIHEEIVHASVEIHHI
jgi:hypothetical protein